jgi:hypothetical protein
LTKFSQTQKFDWLSARTIHNMWLAPRKVADEKRA